MTDTIYTLVLDVRDQPGVLVRVAQVFARRGCNIRAIQVHHPADAPWSRMTITVQSVPRIDHIVHQLEKLVDVYRAAVRMPEGASPPATRAGRTVASQAARHA